MTEAPAAWERVGRGPRRRTRWDRPPHPHDWRFYVGWLGRILIVLGVMMFLFVAYQLWGTGIETARAQNRLEDQFAELLEERADDAPADTAAPGTTAAAPETRPATTTPATTMPATTMPATTAPSTTTPATTAVPAAAQNLPTPGRGDPVARLVIPRIGVDWIVVAGVSRDDLKEGPGHFDDTPYPGQLGNAAIAGHRTTHGAPFGDLDRLAPGDTVEITMGNAETYVYVVTGSEVVAPSDYHVISDSDPTEATLTLVTCTPKWSSTQRLIVYAELDAARSAPVGEPTDNALDESGEGPTVDDPTFVAPTTDRVAATSVPGTTTATATTPATSPASAPSTTRAPVTDDPDASATSVPVDSPAEPAPEAFASGWFADDAAWPQIALWGLALAAMVTLGWWLARFWKREWAGALAVLAPTVACLYFFFQNVNRLLPAGL